MNNSELEPSVLINERRTVELCGDELRRGARCVLARGHDGSHECYVIGEGEPIVWPQSPAAQSHGR